jgi:hypothetical protein
MADPKTSGPDGAQLLRLADEAIDKAGDAVEAAVLHIERQAGDRLRERLAQVKSPLDRALSEVPGGEERTTKNYERSGLATEVIECLETREAEVKERLKRLTGAREAEGVERGGPATGGQLVAYTEARIYRDAILTVADRDLERHLLGPATADHAATLSGGTGAA